MANNIKKTKVQTAFVGKQAQTAQAKNKATSSDCQGKDVVIMDRRTTGERRSGVDRRQRDEPVEVERRVLQRRAKVNRRRQIDPTTCERDYTADEIEFMNALERYKRASGRMFPTCSEILEVLRSLGYEKRLPQATQLPASASHSEAAGAHINTPCAVAASATGGE